MSHFLESFDRKLNKLVFIQIDTHALCMCAPEGGSPINSHLVYGTGWGPLQHQLGGAMGFSLAVL